MATVKPLVLSVAGQFENLQAGDEIDFLNDIFRVEQQNGVILQTEDGGVAIAANNSGITLNANDDISITTGSTASMTGEVVNIEATAGDVTVTGSNDVIINAAGNDVNISGDNNVIITGQNGIVDIETANGALTLPQDDSTVDLLLYTIHTSGNDSSGIQIGTADVDGNPGHISIITGGSAVGGTVGALEITGGDSAEGIAGSVIITSGASGVGTGGGITLQGGDAETPSDINIFGGDAAGSARGSDINVNPGDSPEAAGGDINLICSTGTGSLPGNVIVTIGSLSIATAGQGLNVKEGTNARQGASTLVGGTVTVSTTAVTTNSRIFVCPNNTSGTAGAVAVSGRTAGTSFTITSTSGADTRLVAWEIFEPAA